MVCVGGSQVGLNSVWGLHVGLDGIGGSQVGLDGIEGSQVGLDGLCGGGGVQVGLGGVGGSQVGLDGVGRGSQVGLDGVGQDDDGRAHSAHNEHNGQHTGLFDLHIKGVDLVERRPVGLVTVPASPRGRLHPAPSPDPQSGPGH